MYGIGGRIRPPVLNLLASHIEILSDLLLSTPYVSSVDDVLASPGYVGQGIHSFLTGDHEPAVMRIRQACLMHEVLPCEQIL